MKYKCPQQWAFHILNILHIFNLYPVISTSHSSADEDHHLRMTIIVPKDEFFFNNIYSFSFA